ncbi:PilZ domain-containing protein [Desulfocapsa sulfexigens DSM 10523]|uniref:PilZ domain-containing protein n=1 Tax=Desulfocapsa sulfexigens (strain DSM 10523 / SB164P1) TaxID=1167006 RepID=M1PIC4_DESSD|nr:PilZ domain-containing protein [Desulfocapsa sulfexigens]AGF79345.1 PilZ domain-containing protein [Desulfocapsa sulfexigens DSM 10523]
MEKVDPVERRAYCRVSIDMDIEVCHIQDEGQSFDLSVILCRGRDVSGGGISFYGHIRYTNESLLRLQIPLSTKESTSRTDGVRLLKVLGKVMWCKKNIDTNSYVTGVQFLNIYEQDFKILVDYVHGCLSV